MRVSWILNVTVEKHHDCCLWQRLEWLEEGCRRRCRTADRPEICGVAPRHMGQE